MKKQTLWIILSGLVGALLFYVLVWAGSLLTFVIVGKCQIDMIWILGGYLFPFFVGGFMLARINEFSYQSAIAPICSLLAYFAIRYTNSFEFSKLLLPNEFQLTLAVLLSMIGSLLGKYVFKKRTETNVTLAG